MTFVDQQKQYLVATLRKIHAEAVVNMLQHMARARVEAPYAAPWWARWNSWLKHWWDRREHLRYARRVELHQRAAMKWAAVAAVTNTAHPSRDHEPRGES